MFKRVIFVATIAAVISSPSFCGIFNVRSGYSFNDPLLRQYFSIKKTKREVKNLKKVYGQLDKRKKSQEKKPYPHMDFEKK